MDIYVGNIYILVFFVYGLAFFTMGITALQHKVREGSALRLLRANRYLGYFGIIHGITEWVLMVIIARIYPHYNAQLLSLASLLNAVSFVYLLIFGIAVTEYNGKPNKTLRIVLWFAMGLAIALFVYMILNKHEYIRHWNPTMSIFSRYFIGLPGSLITAAALYKNSHLMHKIKLYRMALRIKGLSIAFFLYGILAGVFVRKGGFFPANIINNELFHCVFGFPIEIGRAAVAIAITILYVGIIDIFRWETDQTISKLTKEQAASQERRKLAQEMHDVVLQYLFATGLQVENLLEIESDENKKVKLVGIKQSLNDTILHIRSFINNVSKRKMGFEDLKTKICELIDRLKKAHPLAFQFDYDIPSSTLVHVPTEKLTEIYYILQEAINNAIKHGSAAKISVCLWINANAVMARVSDDGIGFNIENEFEAKGYGLQSMRERAASIGGRLTISSDPGGTAVSLEVPWEVYLDEPK